MAVATSDQELAELFPDNLDREYYQTLPAHLKKALIVKAKPKVTLKPIPGWSTKVADRILSFQQKAIVYAYFAIRLINADAVGIGKTIETLGLLQLLKHRREGHRALILTTKSARQQWSNETRRFTNLTSAVVSGPKANRVRQYGARWDVIIAGYPTVLRDYQYLANLDIDVLILDESGAIRNHETQTAQLVKQLSRRVRRIVCLDATPVQTSLLDFHSLTEVLHMGIFGPLPAFEIRYVRRTPTKVKRGESTITENQISGYKHFSEFKRRISPFYLRRLATDPNVAAELPPVSVENVWLDLPKRQRQAYDMARKGIIAMFKAGDRRKARSNFHTLQQACDSTIFFGDEIDVATSVKIDWLLNALRFGDLVDEKVVCFVKYKRTIEHVRARLRAAGIKSVIITGDVSSDDRAENVRQFWFDPNCRVIIGTSAMERALNLQNAAYVVNINQMWNPARMQQILGRIHRIGSKHERVIMVNLLINETVEEKLSLLQSRRQAVHDATFDESSDIFESLSDAELQDMLRD